MHLRWQLGKNNIKFIDVQSHPVTQPPGYTEAALYWHYCLVSTVLTILATSWSRGNSQRTWEKSPFQAIVYLNEGIWDPRVLWIFYRTKPRDSSYCADAFCSAISAVKLGNNFQYLQYRNVLHWLPYLRYFEHLWNGCLCHFWTITSNLLHLHRSHKNCSQH